MGKRKCGSANKKVEEIEQLPLWGSCRFLYTVCAFLTTLNLIFMRFNIGFAMVCMIKDKVRNNTSLETNYSSLPNDDHRCGTSATYEGGRPTYVGEFDWSKEMQGRILSGFFYGYLVSQCFGGWFSDRFGGKILFVTGNLLQSVCTLLMPVAARFDPNAMFILRIVQGIVCGLSLPAMYQLYTKWASPVERTKLMGIAYTGFPLANCLMFPVAGLMCEYGIDGGWPGIFYTTGMFGLITSISFIFIVYDNPDSHPRITEKERNWLNSVCTNKKSTIPPCVPWKSILLSVPFHAYIVAHFCQTWGFITLANYLPQLMKEVLYFDIKSNGVLSALPYLSGFFARLGIALAFHPVMSYLGWSITNYRKFNHALGTIIPGLAVLGISFLTCHEKYWAVVLFTIGNAFSDIAFTGSYLLSFLELSPPYVGLLTGISNTVACFPGFLAPEFVGHVTSDGSRQGWMIVLYTMAGFYFCGTLFYVLFGSSELQPWAKITENDESEKNQEPENNKECKC